MAYIENGFIPKLKNPWGTGLHNFYWEYMWSMVARSIVWAAAKEPQTFITKVSVNVSSLIINLNKANAGDSLHVIIEDEFGVIDQQLSIPVKPQQAIVKINLPGTLHGGEHIGNITLKGLKGVYDWYSTKFSTKHNASIVSITNNREEVPAGEPVQSSIMLISNSPFAGRLIAKLYDNYNRLVNKKELSIKFSGNKKYDVTLDSKNILTHLGRVEFLLYENDKQADRKSKDIFFFNPESGTTMM